MKLSHIILTGALLITFYTAQSQTEPEVKKEEKPATETKVTYEELKELYMKRENSESYKLSKKLMTAFYKKMNYSEKDRSALITPDSMLVWIKANLEKTYFASYEEATEEFDEMMAAGVKSVEENKDFYTAMRNANREDARRVLMEGINPYSEY